MHIQSLPCTFTIDAVLCISPALNWSTALVLEIKYVLAWNAIACCFHGHTTSTSLLHISYLKPLQWDAWKVLSLYLNSWFDNMVSMHYKLDLLFDFSVKFVGFWDSKWWKEAMLVSGVPYCLVRRASGRGCWVLTLAWISTTHILAPVISSAPSIIRFKCL